MALHGVEADDYVKLGNMKFLYDQVKKADRILHF
jgi:uncharacterized protein involved in oxidation of intracellular sulfur